MNVPDARPKVGSVLILALWVLFFLASLTVASAGHVLAVLRAAERLQARVQERTEAWSAAAWAVSVIAAQQAQEPAATNSWDGVSPDAWNRDPVSFTLPETFDMESALVRFRFPAEDTWLPGMIGEEGRIHLNAASPDRLQILFGLLGGQPAEALAAELFVPRGDGGLTPDGQNDYDRPSYRSVEELRAVEGMTADLYAQVAPHVTVYGSGNLINVNAATKTVLLAVLLQAGRDPATAGQLADLIVTARKQRGFRSRTDLVERVDGLEPGFCVQNRLSVASTAFRGIASGGSLQAGTAGLQFEFVWDTRSGQYMMWRERVWDHE